MNVIETYIKQACDRNSLAHLSENIHYRFCENTVGNFSCAYPSKMLMEISATLWAQATPEEQRNVIIHECCHILTYKLYGTLNDEHGKEWQRLVILANEIPYQTFWELKNRKNLYKFYCKCLICFYKKGFATSIMHKLRNCSECNAPIQMDAPN
jgi:predicted SprT family Zn-dependent metalloprotease